MNNTTSAKIKLTDSEKKARKAAYDKKYQEANKEKMKTNRNNWRKANTEKVKTMRKKHDATYKAAHPERIKACGAKRYAEKKDTILSNNAAYKLKNKEKVRAQQKVYRARKKAEKAAAEAKEEPG